MGLFDKKYCDICGEKIGLLGNRKLEDGNLCKDCAKKLSPWFSERRHSNVDEIKNQLAYREENKGKVSQFQSTRTIGEYWKVLIDETHRWLIVTSDTNWRGANPDVIDFSSITGCRMDIDEDTDEVFRKDNEGKNVRYDPPRYRYSYDFYIVINVNNPYFDEIKFRINPSSITFEPQPSVQITFMGRSITGDNRPNPEVSMDYCRYRDIGNEICAELDRARGVNNSYAASPVYNQPSSYNQVAQPVTNANEVWNCVSCGSTNTGKFCQNCGSGKPNLVARCTNCGWTPPTNQNMPRFCPECGKQL